MGDKLRFAVIGCGFWSRYQIGAWLELKEVELVALYDRHLDKANEISFLFGPIKCYDNIQDLFEKEQPDFVDIVTDVNSHAFFVKIAAGLGVPVICQKPMAPSLSEAKSMMNACRDSGTPFFVHENFRWQLPIRKVKALLEEGIAGSIFRARISFCSAFPVFDNQPFLKDLKEFILTDIGSHLFDVARFLFGEANTIYARATTVNKGIEGEDVATVFLLMESGVQCLVEMSYASILERESFPQTLLLIEGSVGSISVGHDFEIRVTTRSGTDTISITPPQYQWADPAYAVVHSSIVACNRNLLAGLQGKHAETTASDNFKTVQLVWAAYESFKRNEVIPLKN